MHGRIEISTTQGSGGTLPRLSTEAAKIKCKCTMPVLVQSVTYYYSLSAVKVH